MAVMSKSEFEAQDRVNKGMTRYIFQEQLVNNGKRQDLFQFGQQNPAMWQYDSSIYQLSLWNQSNVAPLYLSYSGVAYTHEMGSLPVLFNSGLPKAVNLKVVPGDIVYFYNYDSSNTNELKYKMIDGKKIYYNPKMSADGTNTYVICDRITVMLDNSPNFLYVFNCNNEGAGDNNLILMSGDVIGVET